MSEKRSEFPQTADVKLVRQMAAGSVTAFGAFYDLWADRVYSCITRVIADTAVAEPLVEASFWQAWQSASSFPDGDESVSKWLLSIVRSTAVNHIRMVQLAVRTSANSLSANSLSANSLSANSLSANSLSATAEADRSHSPSMQTIRQAVV